MQKLTTCRHIKSWILKKNVNNLENTRKVLLAIYFCKISTDRAHNMVNVPKVVNALVNHLVTHGVSTTGVYLQRNLTVTNTAYHIQWEQKLNQFLEIWDTIPLPTLFSCLVFVRKLQMSYKVLILVVSLSS